MHFGAPYSYNSYMHTYKLIRLWYTDVSASYSDLLNNKYFILFNYLFNLLKLLY